jgi:hypothetical protein
MLAESTASPPDGATTSRYYLSTPADRLLVVRLVPWNPAERSLVGIVGRARPPVEVRRADRQCQNHDYPRGPR